MNSIRSTKKLTSDFVRDFLINKDIEWLDYLYINNRQALNLCCMVKGCGYEWHNTLHNLKDQDQGCPKCAKKLKYEYSYVYDFLFSRDILLVENEYKNANLPIKLKCLKADCNYEWAGKFSDIKNNGTGCAKCGKRLKHSYNFVKNTLLNKKISLISDVYQNNKASLELLCMVESCRHKWKASFLQMIKPYAGCPCCLKSKNEKLTGEYLRQLLNVEVISQYKIKTDIMKPKNLYVDYYFKLNNIEYIVEYNGLQHYKYVSLFHHNDIEAFNNQQKRDKWLADYCKNIGIRLIVIDSRIYKNDGILDYLEEQIGIL